MKAMRLLPVLAILVLCGDVLVGAEGNPADLRAKAEKERKDGNYRDAFELYRKLCLDRRNDPKLVGQDLNVAISCLQRINRVHEIDAFREKVIEVHKDNWRFLWAAAQNRLQYPHYGFMIAGEFHRGHHRGGGQYVNAWERDRVRALQLMSRAVKVAARDRKKEAHEIASYYLAFSDMILRYRGYNQSWRLGYRTDLSELPDFEPGYGYYHRGGGTRGAPVDEKGEPVLHRLPKSYEAAATDGERWRWLLMEAMELDRRLKHTVLGRLAGFLHGQFGVQTMAYYGRYLPGPTGEEKSETGPFAVHTLGEDESIARLATGLKRFKLPDEFNYIKIYRELGNHSQLAGIFENRRQYDKAAEHWKMTLGGYWETVKDKPYTYRNPQNHPHAWERYRQILGNWGTFEPVMTHPAGEGATVEFRFRNGKKVHFEARRVDVPKLLADVKRHIKSHPAKLKHERVDVRRIGWRLVHENQTEYVKEKVAGWDLELEPRPKHWDKRITVSTPLQKAGAYLLTAEMEGGNTSRILMWLNDTVIVRKPLKDKAYYYVADAVTGRPLPEMNVEFFGYWQEWISGTRRYRIHTKNFAEFTDDDGQIVLGPDQMETRYSWLATATTKKGRLAYLGWSSIWYGRWYDYEYNRTKMLAITDRPVYRPKHTVKFKVWTRQAKYDQGDTSVHAGRDFHIQIHNPKGEKVFQKTLKADAYGGVSGEWTLPADAMLGMYGITGGSFRVEEYKKPEFEVKVDAPAEPVALGEKIEAKVEAKYYFGAPVAKGTIKYKVLRYGHDARWYPVAHWDWFYGRGYWWFGYDYPWYPGWYKWGCCRPVWWLWHRPSPRPEVVAEGEAKLASDGTYAIAIDTAPAKAMHGDVDHRYEITAEVRDESRRTIVGTGKVLVARRPFKVYAWVDRGHYRVGDVVRASFNAQTLDGEPVQGKGALRLLRITYDRERKPVEKEVARWDVDTNDEGRAAIQLKASRAGQYRLSYALTDAKKHTIEGGYVFVVRGRGFDGKEFRFNHLELVTDKREYKAGEKVKLMVNTDRAGGTVVLFVRPSNGVYLMPKVVRLEGKSALHEIAVTKRDMPNFFVEAFTITGGKLYSETREVVVPPEKRVLNVEVLPSAKEYKPGEKAKVRLKLTDFFGEPFVGSTVLSIYDKSVEYISGGSNVPEIRAFFWKWRRRHHPQTQSSFGRWFSNLLRKGEIGMGHLGVFGHLIADEFEEERDGQLGGGGGVYGRREGAARQRASGVPAPCTAPTASTAKAAAAGEMLADAAHGPGKGGAGGGEAALAQPAVRTKFADTALWVASLATDADGTAEVELDMPENLTGWLVKVWAMGHGTRVGQGQAEVVTKKDLLLRMQAPRFFVQKDEVVLSANVHNYLKTKKKVRVVLEVDANVLEPMGRFSGLVGDDAGDGKRPVQAVKTIEIAAGGEERVDWRVKVMVEGEAVVRMKALTDEESDAMEMRFPAYVHGMDKMVPKCGVVRPDKDRATVTFTVPAERRVNASRLEIRYSPTLAGAMVDALPYLVEYPYGCTEQTLNRFLPAVITQNVLKRTGVKLEDIKNKMTNLNAQEIGDDKERAAQWKKHELTHDIKGNLIAYNPVWDEDEVQRMVKEGVRRLTAMQLSDGGWGWFSGWGERSYPHTTAYVVHGLQIARENRVAIVPGVLDRGIAWLKRYQADQVRLLKLWVKTAGKRGKPIAGNLDAFVFMVLVDADHEDGEMRDFLYRDRNGLAVYAKSMYDMALHRKGREEKLAMIMRNIEQFLIQDDENQTAYLNLQNGHYWWYWYGSEYEAQAYYLKLLARVDPKGEKAPRLVKYLLNNRKHATYWNSTRDTAICIEAFADYLAASGESEPDMTVEILVDGKKMKEVKITKENLFTFDNKFLLLGDAVETGEHTVEVRRIGKGSVYFNAYMSFFTLEDYIPKAGLEIKVERKFYKLERVEKTIKVAGSRGQALDQKVEKYKRVLLEDLATLKSGDLVEIELEIESKNDYEYLVFEDMKAAGFEAVDVRSGYSRNGMGAYMELRDERVSFFVRWLARGKHSISYRMRAEIPGRFSALPTRAHAMYAPELRANSDEIKLKIVD